MLSETFHTAMSFLETKDKDHRRKQTTKKIQSAQRHKMPKKNEDKRDAATRGWKLKPSKISRKAKQWSKSRAYDRDSKFMCL